jgi:DNA polymerase/3'-5' exonuclease PolX
VRQLKGFGAKTEQTILHGIRIAAAANERIYWAEADAVAQDVKDAPKQSARASRNSKSPEAFDAAKKRLVISTSSSFRKMPRK